MISNTIQIDFAERQGIRWDGCFWRRISDGGRVESPNPTDRNHVHAALMGMTNSEWRSFSEGLYSKMVASTTISSIEQILKTPLFTLVSCYLKATEKRVQPVTS
jgi:hypothetical protein